MAAQGGPLSVCLILFSSLSFTAWAAGETCRLELDACVAAQREMLQARGFLGIGYHYVEDEDLPGYPARLLVHGVYPGSSGDKAGVRPGDLILAIGDQRVVPGSERDVRRIFERLRPGQEVELVVLADGALRALKLEAGKPPAEVVEGWIRLHVWEEHGEEDLRRLQWRRQSGG